MLALFSFVEQPIGTQTPWSHLWFSQSLKTERGGGAEEHLVHKVIWGQQGDISHNERPDRLIRSHKDKVQQRCHADGGGSGVQLIVEQLAQCWHLGARLLPSLTPSLIHSSENPPARPPPQVWFGGTERLSALTTQSVANFERDATTYSKQMHAGWLMLLWWRARWDESTPSADTPLRLFIEQKMFCDDWVTAVLHVNPFIDRSLSWFVYHKLPQTYGDSQEREVSEDEGATFQFIPPVNTIRRWTTCLDRHLVVGGGIRPFR